MMVSQESRILSKFLTVHLILFGMLLTIGNGLHASQDWVVRPHDLCSAIVSESGDVSHAVASGPAEIFPEQDHFALLPKGLQQDLQQSRTRMRDFVLTAGVLFSISKKSEAEGDQTNLPKLDLFAAFNETLQRQQELSDVGEKIVFGHDIAGERYQSWEKQHRELIDEMRYGHRESLKGITVQPIHSERRERNASRTGKSLGQDVNKDSLTADLSSEQTGDDLIRVEDRISRAIGSLKKERDITQSFHDSLSDFAVQIGHMKDWQKSEADKLHAEVSNNKDLSEEQRIRIFKSLKNANEDAQFLLRSLYDSADAKSWVKILLSQSNEHLQSLNGWINELQTELSHSPGAGTL